MEEKSSMYCTNCGKPINEHAEICTSCGVRQGTIIQYCYNCGGPISEHQELCLNCGVNPRKMRQNTGKTIMSSVGSMGSTKSTGQVNIVLATILGFFIPGLPSLLWYNQKVKGISMIVAAILLTIIIPFLGLIVLVIGAIDAYQLGNRINNGEQLQEWTFFWSK